MKTHSPVKDRRTKIMQAACGQRDALLARTECPTVTCKKCLKILRQGELTQAEIVRPANLLDAAAELSIDAESDRAADAAMAAAWKEKEVSSRHLRAQLAGAFCEGFLAARPGADEIFIDNAWDESESKIISTQR